jgi:hypothetical protein
MRVRDYMTAAPVTIRSDEDYDAAFEIMEKQGLHHLPVVNAAGEVVGIVAAATCSLRPDTSTKPRPKWGTSCTLRWSPYHPTPACLRLLSGWWRSASAVFRSPRMASMWSEC